MRALETKRWVADDVRLTMSKGSLDPPDIEIFKPAARIFDRLATKHVQWSANAAKATAFATQWFPFRNCSVELS